MAAPRVFVSSTAYDLALMREVLSRFVTSLGFEPVLFENGDVLFDPREHIHTSCLNEIGTCDLVVLVVGGRFGSIAVPSATTMLDLDKVWRQYDLSQSLPESSTLSVTQAEILRASELEIPIFCFVERAVYHDLRLFRENRDVAGLFDLITFPSIEQPESARYIFEFIELMETRSHNNAVIPFDGAEDVENHLRRQWSALLQRLLRDSRQRTIERNQSESFASQLEDLKTAVLGSIDDKDARDIARGVIRFRTLVDFLSAMRLDDFGVVYADAPPNWPDLLQLCGIIDVEEDLERQNRPAPPRLRMTRTDGAILELRLSYRRYLEVGRDWDAFVLLEPSKRQIIVDSLLEGRDSRSPLIRVLPPVPPDAETGSSAAQFSAAVDQQVQQGAAVLSFKHDEGVQLFGVRCVVRTPEGEDIVSGLPTARGPGDLELRYPGDFKSAPQPLTPGLYTVTWELKAQDPDSMEMSWSEQLKESFLYPPS
jgi:hypothetical protein